MDKNGLARPRPDGRDGILSCAVIGFCVAVACAFHTRLGMWLASADVHCVFCFDLEFFGDIANSIHECRIWEIGCVCMDTGDVFHVNVLPLLRHDMYKAYTSKGEFTMVSHAFLKTANAVPLVQALHMWRSWMVGCAAKAGKQSCLLVSHNCFKSDAPVLQQEMGSVNAAFYMPTFFFDSLLFMRYAMRGKGISDYSLRSLSSQFGATCNQAHRALSDALQLARLLSKTPIPISGVFCCADQLPLVVFDGIGVNSAVAMGKDGMLSVRQLLEDIVSQHGVVNELSCTEYLLPRKLPRVTDTAASIVKFAKSIGLGHIC